jgi:hypothetical protein
LGLGRMDFREDNRRSYPGSTNKRGSRKFVAEIKGDLKGIHLNGGIKLERIFGLVNRDKGFCAKIGFEL